MPQNKQWVNTSIYPYFQKPVPWELHKVSQSSQRIYVQNAVKADGPLVCQSYLGLMLLAWQAFHYCECFHQHKAPEAMRRGHQPHRTSAATGKSAEGAGVWQQPHAATYFPPPLLNSGEIPACLTPQGHIEAPVILPKANDKDLGRRSLLKRPPRHK